VVRLALFDIDGTLIRTGGAGVRAFASALRDEFGIEHGTEGVHFAGRTDSSLIREILGRHRISFIPAMAERFYARYVFWLDYLLDQTNGGPCAGVMPFLEELRRLPEPPVIGLLTGNIRLGAEIKLRRFGLWDWFVVGAFGDDHEDRNQLSGIAHQRACTLVGRPLRGDEVLVVGDTPADVACGRAIQARTLAVATGGATMKELEDHRPNWAVRTLREVTAQEVCA